MTLEEESGGSLKDVSGLQLTGTQVDVRITGGCNPIGPTQFVRSCRLSGPAGAFAGG